MLRRLAARVLSQWVALEGHLNGVVLRWAARGPSPANTQGQPRKILILRVDGAGDLIMNLAFVQGIRRAFPKAEIWMGLPPAFMELFHDQGVDACVPVTLQTRRLTRFPLWAWQAWQEGRRLRQYGFDTCFLPRFGQDDYWAGFAAWAARIPRREGFGNDNPERAGQDPGLEGLLTKVWRSKAQPMHEIDRLYEALGQISSRALRQAPRLKIPQTEIDAMRQRLRAQGWDGKRPMVLLGLDAGSMCRAWPIEKFAALADAFPGLDWVLQAAPEHAYLVEALGAKLKGPKLDAGFSLRKLAACSSLCRVYVGADSGPKHVAMAMGVPVLEISRVALGSDPRHYTAPKRFGPWLKGSRVIRPKAPLPPCEGPCQTPGPHCITQISSREVAQTLGTLLDRRPRSARNTGRQ